MTMRTSTVTLPPPNYPMVTRVISNRVFPPDPTELTEGRGDEPAMWAISQPHPFVPTMRVVRMFVRGSGDVEVYSLADDGGGAMRNLLPTHTVRFVEEAMPIGIFIEELTLAEAGDDDGPMDPDEPDLPVGPGDPANGSASSPVPG